MARAYCGEDMIRASTKNYAVPYLICHYDGIKSMWIAAGQVAGQIQTWMNANAVDDIVIHTHSFGGVVTRWILSNPTYDSRYQPIINRVRWVNSIISTTSMSSLPDAQMRKCDAAQSRGVNRRSP